jgi:hypothetical protein
MKINKIRDTTKPKQQHQKENYKKQKFQKSKQHQKEDVECHHCSFNLCHEKE